MHVHVLFVRSYTYIILLTSNHLQSKWFTVILNAKQKHPMCVKSEAKLEASISSYSCMRLKSVISSGGQGLSCLASNNVGSLSEGSVSHIRIDGQHIAMISLISYA